MNRISQTFARLQAQGKKALIPYFCAGDPDVSESALIMHAAVEAGASMIELGVPFSDPAADGLTIQQAHERALEKGVTLRDVLEVVRTFRQKDQTTPVILMGYLNSFERMGMNKALCAMHEAGVDGVIVVDLSLEALPDYEADFAKYPIAPILLVAPTTNPERLAQMMKKAQGFLYFISLKGVTGTAIANPETLRDTVQNIRQQSPVPVCIGFGIKDRQSALAMSEIADGVVMGSAFVEHLHQAALAEKPLPQSAFEFIKSVAL